MLKARCIIIPRSNGGCCWRDRRCASRVTRKFRSRRAISGARRATCRTPCAQVPKARAYSTSSVRRARNTGSRDQVSARLNTAETGAANNKIRREQGERHGDHATNPLGCTGRAGYRADLTVSMAKSVKEILSEASIAAQLHDTQQMTLLLQDASAFKTFFDKQVAYWGQVVRENNIKA